MSVRRFVCCACLAVCLARTARAEGPAPSADFDGEAIAVDAVPAEPVPFLYGGRQPEWTAQIDWVCLKRTSPRHTPIVRTSAGLDKLNAADFDFGWTSGLDATLLFTPAVGPALEGRFLKLDDWTDSIIVQNDPTDYVATNPPAFRNAAFAEKWKYQARLQSAELSLRAPLNEWAAITGGVRYVSFDEALTNPALTGAFGPVDGLFGTQNDLVGLQAGLRSVLWDAGSNWRVTGGVNAGLYCNWATSTAEADTPVLLFFARADDSRQNAAFLGEMTVSAQRRLTDVWSVKVGYHLLWMEGVAIAAEQIPRSTDIENGTVPARTSTDPWGSAFFHGVRAGLEANW